MALLSARPLDETVEVIADRRSYRLSLIDFLRSLVIVLMALDHVCDFVMVAYIQDPTADGSRPRSAGVLRGAGYV